MAQVKSKRGKDKFEEDGCLYIGVNKSYAFYIAVPLTIMWL